MLEETIKSELLKIARETIVLGVQGKKNVINLDKCSLAIQKFGASFVTLKIGEQLKGCIGNLQAYRPLAQDVSENAYAAAFEDSRFSPVNQADLEKISIQVSVLSEPEEIIFTSEQDLINQLRPNVDGLILQDSYHRGTFLPSVWESLGEPEEFLKHLKNKAGLDKSYWSDDLSVQRYTTESFSED